MAKELKINVRIMAATVLDQPMPVPGIEVATEQKDRFQIVLHEKPEPGMIGNNITLNVSSLAGLTPGMTGELTFVPTPPEAK